MKRRVSWTMSVLTVAKSCTFGLLIALTRGKPV